CARAFGVLIPYFDYW
nr:immunoglobulin heavy chain junction region [Macaca mulatta]MOV36816.1 immunoglobulin heavy chain junction region [Macaca mulatta]MOX64803.1 immunoglobulin heavy chain junction region [Macaca mulatta]